MVYSLAMNIIHHTRPKPEDQCLYETVLKSFRRQGRTLGGYCRAHGISQSHARFALLGLRRGPIARQLRDEILRAAGVGG